jgi:hypothetical protein
VDDVPDRRALVGSLVNDTTADLIERALAAVEADRADLARGHDGRSCLRQSEGAALAAALAAEKERADRPRLEWLECARLDRMVAAEAQVAALRELVAAMSDCHERQIRGWPYDHALARVVRAREALARAAGEQP